MKRTGIVLDARYREHDTGPGHPERAERIAALMAAMEGRIADYTVLEPRPASGDELALAHDPAFVEDVARTALHDRFAFDADTPTSARSYETARLATGGLLALIDAMQAGQVDNGFAFVRPPGHHAESHRAMGFCLFNHVAVAAQYLRHRYGLDRVLVVDWDLHHGNGTQHLFEADPGVLYLSTHQYPYYPGTGGLDESGRGDGKGYTVNLPFPGGCGDAEYDDAWRQVVEPIAHRYEPQFVLISAGFDAHVRDPLGGMRLTEHAFQAMTRSLMSVAAAYAGGRCAAILEGGYDLLAICNSASAVLEEMRGAEVPLVAPPLPSRAAALVEQYRKQHGRYWRL
jgi:acetoin utilization deacetylase AcuC-like enzyme